MSNANVQEQYIGCTVKELADPVEAAAHAVRINPVNRPSRRALGKLIEAGIVLTADHLALLTSKYHGAGGVRLSVGFLESTPQDLQQRILSHMNAWGRYCNAAFEVAGARAQLRITFKDDGYWSYLGTDVLRIPGDQPTMSLQGFRMGMPESEFVRVVRHETGHSLGFPHEHMRRQLVSRLDPQKTVAYFLRTQGWNQQTVIQQVLTPLEESSIRGTPEADDHSIMCYALPAEITKDGLPIAGGTDINAVDQSFAASVYPKTNVPNPPIDPGTPPAGGFVTITVKGGKVEVNGKPIN